MIARKLTGTVGRCVGVLSIAAVSTLAFAGAAGAAAPQGNFISPIGTVATGTPFDSGQIVQVTVPSGTLTSSGAVFPAHQAVFIAECSAPNGAQPTTAASCDQANTGNSNTILPGTGGSVSDQYTIYSLPDVNLSTSAITCGNTLATECDLIISNNPQDFTTPHVFSQAFLVNQDPNDSGTPAGDGGGPGAVTPEVPLAIGLPLAAAGIMGGLVYRRRRKAQVGA